jgi:GDP-4-dehydro-6-deoxy-D-mannose reductase
VLLGDRGRFQKATGWEPRIPFADTMADLLDYWRERVRIHTESGTAMAA